MKYKLVTVMLLSLILFYYVNGNSIKKKCERGFYFFNGTCQEIDKNVISVPIKCPPGQGVNANYECVNEFI